MSSDSYRLLLDENQSKKDQVEEITKEIEVFKDNVQKLTKEVEQKAKLLLGKQKELREVNVGLFYSAIFHIHGHLPLLIAYHFQGQIARDKEMVGKSSRGTRPYQKVTRGADNAQKIP